MELGAEKGGYLSKTCCALELLISTLSLSLFFNPASLLEPDIFFSTTARQVQTFNCAGVGRKLFCRRQTGFGTLLFFAMNKPFCLFLLLVFLP